MGKAAGMIAIPGNPLDDIEQLRKVNFAMKDGRVIRKREIRKVRAYSKPFSITRSPDREIVR